MNNQTLINKFNYINGGQSAGVRDQPDSLCYKGLILVPTTNVINENMRM